MQDFAAVHQAAVQGRQWIAAQHGVSADLDAEADKLTTELARAANAAAAAAQVQQGQTTVGVFGASQAGKSYLVSRMAAGADGVLSTTWDGEQIDFLTHINPPGHDQEATGFVTRFTHAQDQGLPGFPIRVRVFKEAEIAMILVNSFFNDLEQNQIKFDLSDAALDQHLQNCRDFAAANPLGDEPNYFTLEDAVACADYIARHSGGRLQDLTAEHPFWIKARTLLPQLNLEGRVRFFSFFWKNCKVFSLMYKRICRELLKFGGRGEIYAPLSAFVEKVDGQLMQRKAGTIICISTLKELFETEPQITVCLDKETKTEVSLPFAVLAAVSLEITFPLSGTSQLDKFDVLDFPGARERRKDQLQRFENDEKNMLNDDTPTEFMQEQGSEFIRRGKVAYLFDRYAQRREIDVLLFCIGVRAQQEVSSIVPILTSWIELNAGKTPEERRRFKYPPLLCALTRFDEIFVRQLSLIEGGQPTTADKEMANALERISAQSWLADWDGRPYCRFYPARRPNIPSNTWLTFNSQGVETGINPEFKERIDRIAGELLESDLFAAHVAGPAEALKSVLSPDGGVDRICRELMEHYQLSPEERAQRCLLPVKTYLSRLVPSLKRYARPEGDAALTAYRAQALAIGDHFLQCNAVARIFGRLKAALNVPESEIAALYQENFGAGDNAPRFAREALRLLRAHLQELPRSPAGRLIARETARGWASLSENILAVEKLAEHFSFFQRGDGTWLNAKGNESEIKDNVTGLLRDMCTEISALSASAQCGLQERLTRLLQSVGRSGREELIAQFAVLTARLLSDFIAELDADNLAKLQPPVRYFTVCTIEGNACFEVNQTGETLSDGQQLERLTVKPDIYGFPVPQLDEDARNYELMLAADYCNALALAMQAANAQQSGDQPMLFKAQANRELLAILEPLQVAAGQN